MNLGGQTITVVNDVNSGDPTGYDGVGDPIYGDPTLTVVKGCSVQQHRTSREISTTDVTVARSRLFAPMSAPLSDTSIVVLGAIDSWPLAQDDTTPTFLVDGEPAVWYRKNGSAHHYECYLREQVG